MNISILQICLISLFYCFSNISWPFGSMGQWATINRPLVGGLVVGLILGNPVQGTIIGATINVIYLGLVSAGGSLPADSGMAGIMGTTFALIGGLDTNTALALAVPMGLVGAVIEVLTMTGQCMLIPLADKWIEQGKSKLVIWANTWIPYIVKSIIRFIIVFVILYFGSNALDSVTNALSGRVLDALSVMGGMLPAVGVGMMLLSIFKGNARWFLFLGFLATSFLGLNTIAVAFIFLIVAVLMVGFTESDFAGFKSIQQNNDLSYQYLKAGVMENGLLVKTEEGSPQGGPLSPLLANIYLNEYDQEMARRGVPVIRYADDIVVLAKSKRAAERLLETTQRYLEGKLKLRMNVEKSKVVSVFAIRNFKFLGFALGKGKNGAYIRAHTKSLKKAKAKLKELTSRSQGRNVRAVMQKVKVYIRG